MKALSFFELGTHSHEMEERSMGFEEAIGLVRQKIVFTNHTLVAAGLEFSVTTCSSYACKLC